MPSPLHYREKYMLGIIDVSNSVATYNEFLQNLAISSSIEELIQEQFRHHRRLRILDIGCGSAGFLKEIKQQFGKRIETIGIDLVAFSPENVDQSVVGNVFELSFPMQLHLVFSFRALHEMGLVQALVEKITTALAPSGKAFLAFRLRTIIHDKIEWAGEMTQTDEDFLFSICQQGTWNQCKVSGKLARESFQHHSAVTGILVVLTKPGE